MRLKNGIERFSDEQRENILKALMLAKLAHTGQERDEGGSYIIHPIRIANTLIYDIETSNSDMIMAALLHDVVEDTEITSAEIKKDFGDEVARMVDRLTRDKNKETKKEKFEKTIVGSADVKLLKACDYLDILRSLSYGADRQGQEWVDWHLVEALEMYIPMAEAAGNEWLIKEMKEEYKNYHHILN